MTKDEKILCNVSAQIEDAFKILEVLSYTSNEIESAKLALTIAINSIETEVERTLIEE